MMKPIAYLSFLLLFLSSGLPSQGTTATAQMKSAIIGNHIKKVENLLDQGFDVNTPGIRKWTPIIYAAYYGHYEITKLLIERGANINALGKYGETALMEASCEGRGGLKMVNLLIQNGAKINLKTFGGSSALSFASYNGNYDIVKTLLENGAKDLTRSLWAAKRKRHLEVVKIIKIYKKKVRY